MLRSILLVMFRKSIKDYSQAFTTLAGLTLGLTCTFLIYQWAVYEFQFDRYHPDNERTFAVLFNENVDGEIETSEETTVPLCDFLPGNIAEIEAITRIDNTETTITFGNSRMQVRGMYADSGFMAVFRPKLINGDEKPLSNNRSLMISNDLATTLFGNTHDAIGKTVSVGAGNDYIVASVFEAYPSNSTFHSYECILPFNAITRSEGEWLNYYVKLRSINAISSTETRINKILAAHPGYEQTTCLLFSQTQWHLYWNFEHGKQTGGRIIYLLTFIITAGFILIMSVINYITTATAHASKRAREIGIRKMTGATRRTLITQFMTESIITSVSAFPLSVIASHLLLPYFNGITGTQLPSVMHNLTLLAGMFCITIVTGILGGCYPSFLLASFDPITTIRGIQLFHHTTLRKALVIFQFTVATILIFAAGVIHQQTNYLLEKDTGYDKHNVINIWLQPEFPLPLQPFKTALLSNPVILAAGYGGASPMEINGSAEVDWQGKPHGTVTLLNGSSSDDDMLDVLQMKITKGRNFSPAFPSDSTAFIITESAAKLMKLQDPIGQQLTYHMFGEQQGTVIGVVNDFVNDDIHMPVAPVIFVYGKRDNLYNLFVRYSDGHAQEALQHLRSVAGKFHPGMTLQYSFLDADFENQFYNEYFLKKVSTWCTVIAVCIAVLGLLSLATFHTQRKTKEIGIRKMLGASNTQILFILYREFLQPVLLAVIIAFPITFPIIEKLRSGYAHIVPAPFLFLSGIALAMVTFIGLIISLQCIRAARKRPVETMKAE